MDLLIAAQTWLLAQALLADALVCAAALVDAAARRTSPPPHSCESLRGDEN